MAARPRIRKRANWPAHLREPRPGYYTWVHPITGKSFVLGRIPLVQAIFEAHEANASIESQTVAKKLAERVTLGAETVADLIPKLSTEGIAHSTILTRRSLEKRITAAFGTVKCAEVTTRHVADLIEAIEKEGKNRTAQAMRSHLTKLFTKGMALGWMDKNPAAVTEAVKVKTARQRLTLDQFQAIRAKAKDVADWLENAMLLALITGQDRSTIVAWERATIGKDVVIASRSKTGVKIAIPLDIRLGAIDLSLRDVLARCRGTGVVSRYLVHHIKQWRGVKRGDPVHYDTLSNKFAEARTLAGIKGKNPPTFHEIRSLTKRLYEAEGRVDTKALLGHKTQKMADLYADARGVEPVKVRFSAK